MATTDKNRDLFGEKLQTLRKSLGLSRVKLLEGVQTIAAHGSTADKRQLQVHDIRNWETARQRRRPTRVYMGYLIGYFYQAGKLSLEEGIAWAALADHVFEKHEVQPYLSPFWITTNDTHHQVVETVLTKLTAKPVQQQRRREMMVSYLQQASQVAGEQGQAIRQVELAIKLAQTYQQQANLRQAIQLYETLLTVADELPDEGFLAARVQNNVAYLYAESNPLQWPQAEKYCFSALKTFQQLKQPNKMGHAHNHLGVLYTRWQREPQLTENHLLQAQRLWQIHGDAWDELSVSINLGFFYLDVANYNQALRHLDQAKQLAESLGADRDWGVIQMNMGIVHQQSGELEPAEHYFEQARENFIVQRNLVGLAQVSGNLGLLHADQGQLMTARLRLEDSFEIWESLGNPYGIKKAQNGLVSLDKLERRFFVALCSQADYEQALQQQGIG